MKSFLMKSFLAILALSPFLTLTTTALTACQDLADAAGYDDPGQFISYMADHLQNNEEYCEAQLYAHEESPEEVYSDAIIFQSWHYCVEKFGGAKYGSYTDWQRLGLTNNSADGLEGKDVWPYNGSTGLGNRCCWGKRSRDRAASRVAQAAGIGGFGGNHFTALVGLVTFGDNYPGKNKREAVNQFFEDTTSGASMDQFDTVVGAFKEGRSHPSFVRSPEQCREIMNKCGVPDDIQAEYHDEATALSVVGDPDD
jgi:hypothetical protein